MFDPDEWAEVIKYSPDESMLAVGSHDNNIYIYDVSKDYTLKTKCVGHTSFITCLDWTADSTYIRSNCGSYDLLYFNLESSQKVTKNEGKGATITKDFIWKSQTCKFGWAVQGIFPLEVGSDGTFINTVDSYFED